MNAPSSEVVGKRSSISFAVQYPTSLGMCYTQWGGDVMIKILTIAQAAPGMK